MKLTKEQFDNQTPIYKKIKEKYKDFNGFHGSVDDMTVVGITEEQAREELDKIDMASLISESAALDEKSILSKLLILEERVKKLEDKVK